MIEKAKVFLHSPVKRTSLFNILSILLFCIIGIGALHVIYLLFAINAFLFYRDYKGKKVRFVFLGLFIIFLFMLLSGIIFRALNISFVIYASGN